MKNLILLLILCAGCSTAQKQIQSQSATPVEVIDKWEIERDLEYLKY